MGGCVAVLRGAVGWSLADSVMCDWWLGVVGGVGGVFVIGLVSGSLVGVWL